MTNPLPTPEASLRQRRRWLMPVALLLPLCAGAVILLRSQQAPAAKPAGAAASAPAPAASGDARTQAAGAPAPGQGFHDPRSKVPRLADRKDVVSWELLGSVKARVEKNRIVAEFPDQVKALHRTKVKVQGYMLPLQPGQTQDRFLLSAVPTSCPFCIPAGPEGLIEIRMDAAVKYTENPIVIEGHMAILAKADEGLYYRIADGKFID
jgi:hypothetical protein